MSAPPAHDGQPAPANYGPPQPWYPPPAYALPGGYPPPVPMRPVGMQPHQEWMATPRGIPNCPPGLEYLAVIDQLLVKQKVDLLEAFTGFQRKNSYNVYNSLGQKVYFIDEDRDLTIYRSGPLRPFNMMIKDSSQKEVLRFNRPLNCCNSTAMCLCSPESLDVFASPDQLLGRMKQESRFCTPSFSILNATEDTVLKIEGPFCTSRTCRDVEFKVLALDGSTQVGKISKQWSGFTKEYFTDADNFGVSFPMDLDVNMKAVMLGAVILIDFMYYEQESNHRNRQGMYY